MNLTSEQQQILTHVRNNSGLILIDSVAGSGKTAMLVAIANAISHKNGLYLAYNKAIATEASCKFPKTTNCSTTHSLAYQATVKQYKLKLSNFNYKNITEKIKYEQKLDILDNIREFCLSKYINFLDYSQVKNLIRSTEALCMKYLDLMETGKIECTHDFYLKLFHILLSKGNITYNNFDFIMLDEAGDLNEVTLEIFKLLPATRKIAVGDPFQNIYTFNHTINCFKELKNEGTLFRMSQSFRVADFIAKKVEKFSKKYLDPEMSFKGITVKDTTIKTKGYLTRTNGALISKMIELEQQGIEFGLVRKASEIFKLPLMLCSLKHQGFITEPAYKHIQADINDWYESPELKHQYKSPLSYLSKLYMDDMQLMQAIRLIQRYGISTVLSTYKEARKHEKSKQSYILATAHSCKGMEFDEVTIASDLNDSIVSIKQTIDTNKSLDSLTTSEQESLNLYYVAVSRSKKSLINAIHL